MKKTAPAPQPERHAAWPIGLSALAVLAVALFSHVLFAGSPRVLSTPDGDLATQFIHWRRFGFGELATGNLPLWNPHVFCGVPFFGGFQSALLYPPNALFLVLPLAWAINLSIVGHLFLTGAGAYLWAWKHRLGSWPCFLAGAMTMLGGPVFLHIYPGHLSNLCAMPWAPFVLMSLEGIVETGGRRWWLAGACSTALLLLAGHPQYVFHIAVAAALYTGWLLAGSKQPARSLGLLCAMGAAAVCLAAPQLTAGLAEARHTVRAEGLWYDYAAMFSLPPENLVTWLAPDFLGSLPDRSYWGRCLLWEMSLFVSVTGFAMMLLGALQPRGRPLAIVAAILLMLALGSNTPLFRLLYELVPGFGSFRGHSKFAYPMVLFVAMLAALGLQRVSAGPAPGRAWRNGLLGAAAVLLLASIVLASNPGWWQGWMKSLYVRGAPTNEALQPPGSYDDPAFVAAAASRAARGVALAAVLLGVCAWLTATRAAAALALLATVELLAFAAPLRPTFDIESTTYANVATMLRSNPGDYRILFIEFGNSAMSTGAFDVWGHDPGTPRRIAELLAFTQGEDPAQASQYVTFRRGHPLLDLLRLQYVLRPPSGDLLWKSPKPPLPRLMLVQRYVVAPDRDSRFAEMMAPGFDPRAVAILEEHPEPRPQEGSGEPGTARLVEESTDHAVLEADLTRPALLVMTDAWHPYWRADTSRLLPADHVLRCIPLPAGKHRVRLDYVPPLFWPSILLQILSLAATALYFTCSRMDTLRRPALSTRTR